ncbi:gamma-aminobutyraldehyde dehydrogenase [Kutzneria kofuensis]|uniref:Betaine-aldehyde dehydrogenase n=1 Tax=Kutzneria kofuensis TaxID=103725 RepID=A0A7W9KBI6_9PSEU|nr:gamma-aminobutyraldehyde dehydrogenase [Kutzneria kofuensis]MBB5889574.1 betaine-aldehyde dehydrogenase [Kutzneria kofuensis]
MAHNVINGERLSGMDGLTADVVDPATGEVNGSAPISGPSDVDKAVRAAAAALRAWRRSTPRDRAHALLGLAAAVEDNAKRLADAECAETGKQWHVVLDEEIPASVDALRFFAGAARNLEGRSAGEYASGLTSTIRREPVGVCAQITPWNYPLLMAVWKIAPAVAAGNTTVVKPAETTPSSTVLLAELAGEYLPAGVVNVICGDRETGRLLVEHPVPALVSITGSTRAGMQVAASAAATLKRTHLELGGNAPVIVFDDVDVTDTAEKIVAAAFYNAGQDCTAASRVLVHADVHDELVEALTKVASAQRTGRGPREAADFGPLNSQAQLDRVTGLVSRLPAAAVVHCGGHRVGDRGFFFAPTVISGVRQDDEIVQEEVFAPVITVQSFGTEEEAVELANGVPYGLASSVWSESHRRVLRVSSALDFGCVWVNTHGALVSEMPHGGFKQSGYGKDLSGYGFEDYTRVKHVMSAV